MDKGLYSVSFKNPNGDIVTVVQNELNRKQRLALVVDGQGTIRKYLLIQLQHL